MSAGGYIERTPETSLLVQWITGEGATHGPGLSRLILADGRCRRINGRYLVGNVLVPDEDGNAAVRTVGERRELITKRRRFRIPKGHPWRGHRA